MTVNLDLLWNTSTLVKVVENLFFPQNWFIKKFVPNFRTFETEFVSWDIEPGLRQMANFVSPKVESDQVEQFEMTTKSAKPFYIKEKVSIDPFRPVYRTIGEQFGGDLSMEQRAQQNLAYALKQLMWRVERREEWMTVQAHLNGSITASGKGIPNTVIDMGRDPSLTVPLYGNDLWDSGATPAQYKPARFIKNLARQVLKNSGVYPTDLIVTTTPLEMLQQDDQFKFALQYPGSSFANGGNYRDGNDIVEYGPNADMGGIYQGRWGSINIWYYNEWYRDESDPTNITVKPMIPDGSIILTTPRCEGIRCYGPVLDPAANFASTPYFPKTWVDNDPAIRQLQIQSNVFVGLTRPNATASAIVTSNND